MTAIEVKQTHMLRLKPLLVLSVLTSLSVMETRSVRAEKCQDVETLSFNPATYKYLTRPYWDVYRVAAEDTVSAIAEKVKIIRDAYHKIETPSFFKAVLFPGTAAMDQFEGWVYSQVQLRWDFPRNNMLFVPNPEYFGGYNQSQPELGSGFLSAMVQWPHMAKWQKCRDGGAVGIGWYRDEAFNKGIANTYDQDREAIKKGPVSDVYSYKTNILDLVPADVPFLKSMKWQAERFAGLAYGYDPHDNDRLTLYFHWPTGAATNTLHLHVRVNYLMPALEYHRAVMLDDLITYMETKNKPAIEYVAQMIRNQGGLIIPPLGSGDGILKDAFSMAFPHPVLKTAEDKANNPFVAIHKVIMHVSANPSTAKIQTVSANPGNPSAVRFGEVPLATVIHKDAGITVKNPFTHKDVVVLTKAEIEELGLEAFDGQTVGELLSCVQPFFDANNAKARRCLKSNTAGTVLTLAPVIMP